MEKTQVETTTHSLPDAVSSFAAKQGAARLSQRLWGIDWGRHFPLRLPTSKFVVSEASCEQAHRFLQANAHHVLGNRQRWPQSTGESPELKRRYLEVACDSFGFWRGEEMVGLFIGNPVDWSSYYMRWMCLVPECRRAHASTEFLKTFFDVLAKAGVVRVECETAPANISGSAGLVSLGFRVVGMSVSERWGALTRMYKYLEPRVEALFAAAFRGGVEVGSLEDDSEWS